MEYVDRVLMVFHTKSTEIPRSVKYEITVARYTLFLFSQYFTKTLPITTDRIQLLVLHPKKQRTLHIFTMHRVFLVFKL